MENTSTFKLLKILYLIFTKKIQNKKNIKNQHISTKNNLKCKFKQKIVKAQVFRNGNLTKFKFPTYLELKGSGYYFYVHCTYIQMANKSLLTLNLATFPFLRWQYYSLCFFSILLYLRLLMVQLLRKILLFPFSCQIFVSVLSFFSISYRCTFFIIVVLPIGQLKLHLFATLFCRPWQASLPIEIIKGI